MAENVDNGGAPHHEESLLDKIAGKLHLRKEDDKKDEEDQHHHHLHHDDHDHDHDDGKKDDSSSSSSSSSDDDVSEKKHEVTSATDAPASSVKDKINRLFGRQKPVHQVLGGGKPADVFLWKNKKVSASVLATATAVWVFFELLEYHLLTLLCHILIFSLAILFLWAHGTTLVNKSPPKIPDVSLPERPFLEFASGLTYEINRGLALVHSIAMGRDMKKFLIVIAGLWVLSVLGKCCDFLTLFYINFVLLHTVPVLYEKYEDKVDAFAEKAMAEGKKYYNVVNEKYISKIPRGPLKNKKFN